MPSEAPLVSSVVPFIDAAGHNEMIAIAKSTWLITDAGLVPDPAQKPIEFVDTHLQGDPAKEMLLPSDLVDLKPAAEVMLIRPHHKLHSAPFFGNNVSVRVGGVAFAGEAKDPWPFGPLSRAHESRLKLAGTYDEYWQQNRMPLLPHDFDPRYNQCAPLAQRGSTYFQGDEQITIAGLYDRRFTFDLPGKTVLVSGNVRQKYFSRIAALDTILIWAEQPALTLIWRLVIRPRQKNAELGKVSVNLIRVHTARALYG